MGVKGFTISLMLLAILFSFLYIPTKLALPFSNFRPIMNYPNVHKSNKPYPATFAYVISASKGFAGSLKRLLFALYHPGNYYLTHMDYCAPAPEHREVAKFVAALGTQFSAKWVMSGSFFPFFLNFKF